MNAKREKATKRRLRYRILRRPADERGVSPVVATLILILIAVAAAAALYLWLVGWQGSVTGSISKPGVNQGSFTIGGSTSVYPFDNLAVTQYEQNNTGVTISNTQGGSTAGMLSVCSGGVNIGAASAPFTASVLIANDGCPAADASTITVTTVAYDAVDAIVSTSNHAGLMSINYDTLAMIYADASQAAGTSPKLESVVATQSINNAPIVSVQLVATNPIPVPATITAGNPATYLQWVDIPAAVVGATSGVYTQGIVATATVSGPFPCGTTAPSQYANCYLPTGGLLTKTPCGFLMCATGANSINTVARSDGSGTTQAFTARLIDAESSTTFATQAQLTDPTKGFSGCGSNNLISDCGWVATTSGNGNPGVISAVAADANSIGYASDGLARAAGSGVSLVAFTGVAQSAATDNAAASWYGGILPTTGSSGTIALGINSQTNSADYVTGYLGWRPFDLVTLQPLSGLELNFVQFVLETGVNTALASEAQEVSVYSV